MLRDAELFVVAENMLMEVLGRVRPAHRELAVPPLAPVLGTDPAAPLSELVQAVLADDARVPTRLAGAPDPPPTTPADVERGGAAEPGWQEDVVRVAAAAGAAAELETDGDRELTGPDGPVTVTDYLRRATVVRCLVAHYVAAYLGSTACPLPEELARPLWELTAPDAESWRATGLFGPPLPLPDHVSWRDRFLLTAGHQPHPLGH